MVEGLLIYDDDPKTTLIEKVDRAAKLYRQRLGGEPDVCYVHPKVARANPDVERVGEVRIVSLSSTLRHHYWLCEEEETTGKKTPQKITAECSI